MLRKSEFGRTNNFDLVGTEGYELLRGELATDFPYLTLADLNATILLGIKGELDKYKSMPMNFTRIYQWVKLRAPFSEGYWRVKHPELFAWADLTGLAEKLRQELVTQNALTQPAAIPSSVVRTMLNGLIAYKYQPAATWVNQATHGPIAPLVAKLKEQYPEFVAKNESFLF